MATTRAPARALLSVPEAAAYLGIHESTLRNWLSARQLDYVKVGRLTKISQATLDRYIEAHTMRAVTTS